MCSIPTERRTVSCVTPAAASSSALSCECVVDALWIASDFASPMFARWLKRFSDSMNRLPVSRAALDPERHERAVPAGEHAVGDPLVVARVEPRVVHPLHVRVVLKVPGDGERVGVVTLHPQRQRLDALQEEERVERRERGARVAQQHRAHAADVGGRAERVAPDDAVVARVGLGQPGEALLVRDPVELPGVDDDAADRRAVAADELRERVHDDVGALVEGARADRRGDGVVEDQRHARGVRRLRPRRDVDDVQARVADRLAEDELRVLVGQPGDGARVVRVGPAHLDPVLRQRVGEEVVGAAVELADGDDVVAGARDVQHRVRHRRLAGRRRRRRRRRPRGP